MAAEELKIRQVVYLAEAITRKSDGLARLNSDPGEFKKLNPSNGGGNYETLKV